MNHLIKDKKKLLDRISRIQGQLNGIDRLIKEDSYDCSSILQTIAACRGAINGLMARVIEDHIRLHLIEVDQKPTHHQEEAAEELINIFNTYLK